MTSRRPAKSSTLPEVRLPEAQRDRLAGLATAALDRFPEAASLLLDEMDRADVLPPGAGADDTACLYSWVTFCDEADGRRREVQLVFPHEADISVGRVSVLSLVGAALIGLSVGQSIPCRTRAGSNRLLTVLAVRPGLPDGAARDEAGLEADARR